MTEQHESMTLIQPAQAPCACWVQDVTRDEPGWVLFRHRFELGEEVTTGQAKLLISASQRFTAWLDGEYLGDGPPRSDRQTWGIVALPLPALSLGQHVLAVEVMHVGSAAGKGQIGGPAFLWVDSQGLVEPMRSDAGRWLGMLDPRRRPCAEDGSAGQRGHRAIGQGEHFIANQQLTDWQSPNFDDADWQQAVPIEQRPGNEWGNRSLGCHFVQHDLPLMKREPIHWQRVALAEIEDEETSLQPWQTLHLPANTRARFVLDAGAVMIGYPLLKWTSGKNARMKLTSCEAPVNEQGLKDNRDIVAGRQLPGLVDVIETGDCDTGRWIPSWFRALRYLVVEIETRDDALTLEPIQFMQTGMPLQPVLSLAIEDELPRDWKRLIEVNRATAAACAHETYFDCPAWEQAQFPGDARVQARQNYLSANEDRLAYKAICDLAASVTPSGLLRSHWPSSFEQVIATYSLQWIGMLHDWCRYRGQAGRVAHHFDIARGILRWFLDRRREDGLLGYIDEPLFFDWAIDFKAGCAPQDEAGGSSLASSLLAEACGWMADLEIAAGYAELAPRWHREREALNGAIMNQCWCEQRHLVADTPSKQSFSVHGQVQAVLAYRGQYEQLNCALVAALNDEAVTQPNTLYYRSHLAEALRIAGRASLVHDLLDAWFGMLQQPGITTWPESDKQPRSDCHGWGVMPEIELVHSILGLNVRLNEQGQPQWYLQPSALSSLSQIQCNIALPIGQVRINMTRDEDNPRVELAGDEDVLSQIARED